MLETLEALPAALNVHDVSGAHHLRLTRFRHAMAVEEQQVEVRVGANDPVVPWIYDARLLLFLREQLVELLLGGNGATVPQLEQWVLENGYIELVKRRNAFGRARGFANYFDCQVMQKERMSAAHLRKVLHWAGILRLVLPHRPLPSACARAAADKRVVRGARH